MNERWLPVVGYEGLYEVSDCGRVRSLACVIPRGPPGGPFLRRGRLRKISVFGQKGHRGVTLSKGGKRRTIPVHTVVLLAFVGPRPPGREACHWDGDGANNRLQNLRWGTPKENAEDMLRHGRRRRGERVTGAKLSADKILVIRQRLPHATQAVIAAEFGVNQSTISLIATGRTWSHA